MVQTLLPTTQAELIGSLGTLEDSSDEDIGDYQQRILVSRSQESKHSVTDSEYVLRDDVASEPSHLTAGRPQPQGEKQENIQDHTSTREEIDSPSRPSRTGVANLIYSPATAFTAKRMPETAPPEPQFKLGKRKLDFDAEVESKQRKRRFNSSHRVEVNPEVPTTSTSMPTRPTQDTIEVIDVDALLDEPPGQPRQDSARALISYRQATNPQPSNCGSEHDLEAAPDFFALSIDKNIPAKTPVERGLAAGRAAKIDPLTRLFTINAQLRTAATYKYVKTKKGEPSQPKKLTQKEIRALEKERKDLETKMSYEDYIVTLAEKWHNREGVHHQFLAGAVIFLAQRMTGKNSHVKSKLDMLYKHGANLVSTYDHRLTHIVTVGWSYDTQNDINHYIGEFKPLSQIPLEIKIVDWAWVVGCMYKGRLVAPVKRVYVHESRWREDQALLGNVIVSPLKTKRVKEHVPISSEEEERREKAAKAKRVTRGLIKLKSPTPPPVASSSYIGDPLAEFYGAGSDEEESEAERQETRWKTFRCMQKGGKARDVCPNQDVIEKLQELWKVHSKRPDSEEKWKAFNMMKAIGLIRAHRTRFESVEEAVAIKGIGTKTALKIMEIIHTGELKRLEYERTEQTVVSEMFQGIYGVGPQLAARWFSLGLRTLDDVGSEKCGVKLTAAQKIGIKYHDDLLERMPREEAKAIYDKITAIALSLDPKLLLELMGSYRRGSQTCGDIDILVTRSTEDGLDHSGILPRILDELHASGIVVADLGGESGDELEAKYMGVCRLSPTNRIRRIDILCIPYEQWGGALVYFTGDDIFNRSMRLLANKKGMSLNQRGLWDGVIRDPRTRLKTCEGTLIASRTEKEIFAALGVPWQEPHERIRG